MKQILILVLTCSSFTVAGQNIDPMYWSGYLSYAESNRLLEFTSPAFGNPSYSMGVTGPLSERLTLDVDMFFYTYRKDIGFDGMSFGMEYTSRRYSEWEFIVDGGFGMTPGDILEYQLTRQGIVSLEIKPCYYLGKHRFNLHAGMQYVAPGLIENIRDKSLIGDPFSVGILGFGISSLHSIYLDEGRDISWSLDFAVTNADTYVGNLIVQFPAFILKQSYFQVFAQVHSYGELLGITLIHYSKR